MQHQNVSLEKYIATMDAELAQWRRGDTVPQEKWTKPLSGTTSNTKTEQKSRPERPETPSRLLSDHLRSETPSRPDSRTGDRASTPSLILEKDEREEFLRRENELQDQLAEKESQLAIAERSLQEAKEELKILKDTSGKANRENETLGGELNELKMQLERLTFENREASITMDGLKEANSELTTELC